MPIERPRIVELRRRVQADPASIAFAQLAEEYRRAGEFEAAIAVCRAGLRHHPGYLSARVTLGRTLIETGALDDAERELDVVLRSAPDNLAAIRGMAEIYQQRGSLGQALTYYRRALELARHDPELVDTVDLLAREVGGQTETPVAPTPTNTGGLTLDEFERELLSAPAPSVPDVNLDDLFRALGGQGEQAPPQIEAILAAPIGNAVPMSVTSDAADDLLADLEDDLRRLVERRTAVGVPAEGAGRARALDELERWLAALENDRRQRHKVSN